MTDDRGLVWFRRDLRLEENPAWADACGRHRLVIAAFVLDPNLYRPGTRRSELLLHHLIALDRELAGRGGRLMVRSGRPSDVLPSIAAEHAVGEVHWNEDVSPFSARRDRSVEDHLNIPVRKWWGTLVHSPSAVRTTTGAHYRVFTAFHRKWMTTRWSDDPIGGEAAVLADIGEGVPFPTSGPIMTPGTRGALERLGGFRERASSYGDQRDFPAADMTSHLSADLKFGTVSPRRVVVEMVEHSDEFVRQIAWRDFYAHLLHSNPDSVDSSLNPRYQDIRWRNDEPGFDAWKDGRTGFPIVDAGMRQLRSEGWMPGRVRMIAASFLVKDLLIDWRTGERWFRNALVDGDVAQNVGNWQWVAGTGADAAPYFRVLNPTRQGERFDPAGEYIRRWVPELRELSNWEIHDPWNRAGSPVGSYPTPIVDHAVARQAAVETFRTTASEAGPTSVADPGRTH